jgi:drug/metabolite transporter (DMT)-like permease
LGSLPAPQPTSGQWLPIALGLSMAIIAANVALQYGASRLTSAATSIIMLSEVVFASVSSIALGASVFEAHIGFGALCIMTAALMAALAKPRPTPQSSA